MDMGQGWIWDIGGVDMGQGVDMGPGGGYGSGARGDMGHSPPKAAKSRGEARRRRKILMVFDA